jgi:hypothetical protein
MIYSRRSFGEEVMGDSQDSIHSLRTLPLKKYDEFIDFWSWVSFSTGVRPTVVRLAALPIFAAMLAIVHYSIAIMKNLTDRPLVSGPFSLPSLDDAIRSSYLVQIVVIVVILLIYGLRVDPADAERFNYGKEGQKRLRFWWTVALVSFLLLYIFLWARAPVLLKLEHAALSPESKQVNELLDALLGILSNLCNNLSTFAFLMCFSTMESPAIPNTRSKNERWVVVWMTFLIILTFVEAAVRFLYADTVSQWRTDWFDLLTGTNAGIALAMFCGRLSSPLINPSISVIVPLYFYAILQMSFGFWSKQKGVALIMVNLALILKCLLSAVIAWLLTTSHLIFYMEQMHRTRSQLDAWRTDFREPGIVKAKDQSRA